MICLYRMLLQAEVELTVVYALYSLQLLLTVMERERERDISEEILSFVVKDIISVTLSR
jgi:hypothetical protein